jgi:hypothetical protein
VQLAASHQLNVAHSESTVAISNRSGLAAILLHMERVREFQLLVERTSAAVTNYSRLSATDLLALGRRLQDLLCEVLIDGRRFQAELVRMIDVV